MNDSFDAFEYAAYLRTRWKLVAKCCAAAALLAGGLSLLAPKRYTAVASILIDAPAGYDPRAATAVSPVYLESLKTYEHFADSDTLFVRAVDRFHLRDETLSTPVDSLKRRVLKVFKLRDTKLLEISVTLTDPVKAQAMAQFIAEETANLNKSLSRQSDDEFTAEAKRPLAVSLARLNEAEKLMNAEQGRSPVDSLQSELGGLLELKTRLQRELAEANIDRADYLAQDKVQGHGDDSDRAKRGLAGIGARVETLHKELDGVDKRIVAMEGLLAQRRARLDRLEADRRSARSGYECAVTRRTW